MIDLKSFFTVQNKVEGIIRVLFGVTFLFSSMLFIFLNTAFVIFAIMCSIYYSKPEHVSWSELLKQTLEKIKQGEHRKFFYLMIFSFFLMLYYNNVAQSMNFLKALLIIFTSFVIPVLSTASLIEGCYNLYYGSNSPILNKIIEILNEDATQNNFVKKATKIIHVFIDFFHKNKS